jgi:hypothetical protein
MSTHEDNAARALRFSLIAQESLRGFGISSSVGVTSGPCFCGLVGGETRCEYAALGDTVNCAARLMVRAETKVWCDETTRVEAGGAFEFQSLPAIRMKGKAQLQAVYRVQALRGMEGDVPSYEGGSPLVGRQWEFSVVKQAISDLSLKPTAVRRSLVLVEGDVGMGKTHFLGHIQVRACASARGVLRVCACVRRARARVCVCP